MATTAFIAEPGRTRIRRSGRGAGRLVRPVANPRPPLRAPRVQAVDPRRAKSCVVSAPAAAIDTDWKLTSRGLAVVMVIGLLIAAAALTVIGGTVLRVTSDDYRPATQSAVS